MAALASGCGHSVSQRDYVRRADAVCATFVKEARPLLGPEPGQSLPPPGKLERVSRLLRQTAARLRRLEEPRGDADELTRYVEGLDLGARRTAQLARAVHRGRSRQIDRVYASLASGTAATRNLARGYGFTSCARV